MLIDGCKESLFLLSRQSTVSPWAGRGTTDICNWIDGQSYAHSLIAVVSMWPRSAKSRRTVLFVLGLGFPAASKRFSPANRESRNWAMTSGVSAVERILPQALDQNSRALTISNLGGWALRWDDLGQIPLHRILHGHLVTRSPLNVGTPNHLVFYTTSPVFGISLGAKCLIVVVQPDFRTSAFHVEEGVFVMVAIGLGTVRNIGTVP